MSDYLRTTRACQFGELRPELIASLLAHAEKIGLPDLTVSVVACCETRNLKKKKGLSRAWVEIRTRSILWARRLRQPG